MIEQKSGDMSDDLFFYILKSKLFLLHSILTLTLLWVTRVAQNKPSAACCGRL